VSLVYGPQPLLSSRNSPDRSASEYARLELSTAVAWVRGRLEETQWLSASAFAQRHEEQIDRLIWQFRNESPWFSDRMESKSRIRGASDPASFRRMPIMTKFDVQRAGDRLFCTTVPSTHGAVFEFHSSGSTGVPVTIRRTDLSHVDGLAMTLREHDWAQRSFSLRDCGIKGHASDALTFKTWLAPVDLIFESAESMVFPLAWDTKRLIDGLREFRPSYLQVFPSIWNQLLRTSGKREFPDLIEVRAFGETLDEDTRAHTLERLGIRISENYSSQELGIIASQCPTSTNLHINEEFLYVEILGPDGSESEIGEVGRVIATDLHNYATPLVRYDTGDFAEVAGRCPCGRSGKTLRRVMGRRRNLMRLPDGRVTWPRLGYLFRSLERMFPARQFQVVQTQVDKIIVNTYMTESPSQEMERIFAATFCDMVDAHIRVEFVYHDAPLSRGTGCKYEDFRCLLDAATTKYPP
jgi:phenylacetate-CoA ligase